MVKDKKPDDDAKGTAADPRFAAVQYDPRFQRFPKNKSKVQVDDRFKGMFNDPAFQVGVTVDKRGKKVKGKKNTENMRKYYRLKDEDDWKKDDGTGEKAEEKLAASKNKGGRKVAPSPSASSSEEYSESEEEEDGEEAEAAKRWARMRGLDAADSSSSDEDDEDDNSEKKNSDDHDDLDDEENIEDDYSGSDFDDAVEEDDEEELAAAAEFGVGALAANPKEQIPLLPDATPRLACVDLDWENITAVDILVALRSFIPRGGSITSVTVYPSDYGLERMEAEAKSGPQGIWRQKQQQQRKKTKKNKHTVEASSSDEDISEDDSESDKSESEEEGSDDANSQEEEESEEEREEEREEESEEESESDADGEVDHARLRLYERSKLRWFYAIVDCDSTETANKLYDECDGMELMKTACKFDLRFVPDDQSFKGRKIRDQAKDVPSDYEPPTFQTKALQHTNVELTWDKGDESRKRALTRKLTAEEIKDDDFKAYLATDSESSDHDGDGTDQEDGGSEDDDGPGDVPMRKKGNGTVEDAEAIRERYRRLLLGGGGNGGGSGSGKDKKKSDKERKGKKDWAAADGGTSSDDEEEEEGRVNVHGGKSDRKMEMEVTFTSGLESLGDRLIAKRKEAEIKAGETVWDAYLRRKKEKKAAAKKLGIVNVDSDDDDYDEEYSDDQSEDSEIEEEGKQQGKGKQQRQKGKGGDNDNNDELPSGVADDPFFQHDDDPFNDPFFQDGPGATTTNTANTAKKDGGKKKNKKGARGGGGDKETEDVKRQKAELEMLLLDESALLRKGAMSNNATNGVSGSKPVKLSKKERIRLKKESKRRERAEGSDDEDHKEVAGAGFKMNLEDPRFKDLLEVPEFALDPTDPRFTKAGPGAALIASEVTKRRSKKIKSESKSNKKSVGGGSGGIDGVDGGKSADGGVSAPGSGNKSAADLKLMVASLKRKAAVVAARDEGGGGKKKAAKRK